MFNKRNYKLSIQLPEKYDMNSIVDGVMLHNIIEIKPPLSIHFTVKRDAYAALNTASIEITNLGLMTRGIIKKDKYNVKEYWRVVLEAGYGNDLRQVFRGNIQEAYSEKSGNDWVTRIEAQDGLFAVQNVQVSGSVAKKSSPMDFVNQTLKGAGSFLGGGGQGSAAEDTSARGQVVDGSLPEALNQTVGGAWYIDNEKLYILKPGEYLSDFAYELTPDRLITSPKKRDTYVECDTLFFPQLSVGRLIELTSIHHQYNGWYAVIGFSHNVTIASASAGEGRTSLTLINPNKNALSDAGIPDKESA